MFSARARRRRRDARDVSGVRERRVVVAVLLHVRRGSRRELRRTHEARADCVRHVVLGLLDERREAPRARREAPRSGASCRLKKTPPLDYNIFFDIVRPK